MENVPVSGQDIAAIRKQLEKSNSFWGNFLRGIFWGLGSAIGASTVAAIVLAIATRLFHSAQDLVNFFR